MKLKLVLFSCLAFVGTCPASKELYRPDPKFFGALYPGEKEIEIHTQNDLLETQKAASWAFFHSNELTADNCRPPIRLVGKKGDYEVLPRVITTADLGNIACMIAGFKDVFVTTVNDFDTLHEYVKKIIQAAGINKITFKGRRGNEQVVLYTPKGKQNAELLVKAFSFEPVNHYLIGYLLGYPPRDIAAFYIRYNGRRPREEKISFYNDEKNAQKWLEENKPK